MTYIIANHSIARYSWCFLYYTLLVIVASSCVDEYEADLSASDQKLLVIEGSIVSDSACVFYISTSVPLNSAEPEGHPVNILNDIFVEGDDGSSYRGRNIAAGKFLVPVGSLNPDCNYWLKVIYENETYTSAASQPLCAPEIASVSYVQQREDESVDFLVTPDPTTNAEGKTAYYCWTHDEVWMINTPLSCVWDLDEESQTLVSAQRRLDTGWRTCTNNIVSVGSSADYGGGQIKNHCIYTLDNCNIRFNFHYQSTIRQRAISQAEYEYINLSLTQTDQMGGLFTPQPSELPTNITCTTNPSLKAVGFIGVALNVSSRNIYVSGARVGYRLKRQLELMEEEDSNKLSHAELWNLGKRPYLYEPMTGRSMWCSRWCVDVTHPFWGDTTIDMPETWDNNPDNYKNNADDQN